MSGAMSTPERVLGDPTETLTIEDVLADPAASDWLKARLVEALERDALDAAIDAEVLARLLRRRVDGMLRMEVRFDDIFARWNAKRFLITNGDLWWSNEHGWGDQESATRFTQAERYRLSLPLGGYWRVIEN